MFSLEIGIGGVFCDYVFLYLSQFGSSQFNIEARSKLQHTR